MRRTHTTRTPTAGGFTLIELVVALSLLGLLVTALAPLSGTIRSSRDLLTEATGEAVRAAETARIVSSLERLAVLTAVDSLSVEFIDHRGRRRRLRLPPSPGARFLFAAGPPGPDGQPAGYLHLVQDDGARPTRTDCYVWKVRYRREGGIRP